MRLLLLGGLDVPTARWFRSILLQHPEVAAVEAPAEDVFEGQYLQRLFLPDEYHGGPTAFAFDPHAHLTEAALPDPVSARRQLEAEWAPFTDPRAAVWLDYAPSHLLRTRWFARLAPEAAQVVLLRHPLLYAYAALGRVRPFRTPLLPLLEHWLHAHRLLFADLPQAGDCRVVHAEHLLRDPRPTADEVFRRLGLAEVPLDLPQPEEALDGWWEDWEAEDPALRAEVLKHEDEVRRFGYSLLAKEPLADTRPAPQVPLLGSAAQVLPRSRGSVPRNLLLISFGTRGDLEPSVALARGFERAGYRVRVLSTEDHRATVESSGVAFVSAGPGSRLDLRWQEDGPTFDALLRGVRDLHEQHGADMVRTLTSLVTEHGVDCVLGNSCFWMQAFVRHHLRVPFVNLTIAPQHAHKDDPDVEGLSIQILARDLSRFGYALTNFKIADSINRACEACGLAFRHPEPDLLDTVSALKTTLTLQGYTPLAGRSHVPGLPRVATGFWQLESAAPPGGPDELLAYLRAGPAPVCLNFGSMEVYDPEVFPWITSLLDALRRSGRRCLAIGSAVPSEVRAWAHWVSHAPHDLVFPHCHCVIHHGGSGTTARCLRSGVPALIVPILPWADQETWAQWVHAEQAGIHVSDPGADFAELLERIGEPVYRHNARRLQALLAEEDGVAEAVRQFEQFFRAPDAARLADLETLETLKQDNVLEQARLGSALYVLLREPGRLPLDTLRHRRRFSEALEEQSHIYPICPADWPQKDGPLDLVRHDLPHASALLEWWYFHAHLRSPDGREYSLFSVAFERLVEDVRLAVGHAALLDVAGGRRHTLSLADPRGPELLAPLYRTRPRQDFVNRALAETFERGEYPWPDQKGREPFTVSSHTLDVHLDRIRVSKDADGAYRVRVAPDQDGLGYSLRFRPVKTPLRYGREGIVFSKANALNMFYYSITRLEVDGTLQLDGQEIPVSGSGWYDHEFGGQPSLAHWRLPGNHQRWRWLAVQLDSGEELMYYHVEDSDGVQHSDEVFFVHRDGRRTCHRGRLTPLRTWSSMRTFTEYEVAWDLEVEDLDLQLHLEAEVPNQEIVSVIAQPAYWEGRLRVAGTFQGEEVQGLGFAEQHGKGGDWSDYQHVLRSVSREVRRSVERVYPLEPTPQRLRELVVDDEFASLLDGVPVDAYVDTLVRPVRYLTDRGGKGWRSLGLMVCVDAAGGDPQGLEDCLAFPEVLHTGSLIVDDIEDNSLVRRGGPTCHTHFGTATAINAGTAAYFSWERLLENARLSEQARLRIYQLYFNCLRGAHTGQALDIRGLHSLVPGCLARNDFSELWSAVLAIHRLKSGLAASMVARAGVTLAGGPRQLEDVLGNYFLTLGVAFQIMDDVINLRGFRTDLKTHCEDLLEGKLTTPVVRAFMLLDAGGRDELSRLLEGSRGRDIAPLLNLVERSGAIDWCIQHARDLVEEGWQEVDRLLPASQAKLMLRAFGWFVVHVRDY
jgi:geranylgeranyl pyrophosphate synthase/predicted secreted hydrolase/UDP:flavonoid glycosyltransferase YjiC (YdhE family)